ncbi:putative ribonuclease H-like domain-containing protein [Tanacetum coccineum]|uniref:Ribonuclease H-like domain-containing protein n=1 Tax=Tanacetum coccineum TaxID=301880 RepID=A0ABQ5FJD2_9ASTR
MSEAEPIPPTSSVTALRIPMIKKGEYDLWSMKMRQYIAITDHILWDIITNGDQATTDPASSSVSAPKTSLAANARRNNEKALNILLSAIPDRHLLSFHDAVDAKSLWSAIKARFGGNEASKKMQKNLLKQQFETFTIGSREELDSAYERFQNILSMLELYDAKVSHEDANLKFLRSLPSVWHVVATMIRGQPGLDELEFDDLYNNLKVYEHELKGVSNSSSQNIAFLSTEVKGSTLKQSTADPANIPKGYTQAASSKVQTAPNCASHSDEIICSFFAQQASMPTTHDDEDLLQIDEDAMEEIDIRWQVAMITARIRKFMRKTGRPIDLKPKNGITFDKSKIECFNCQKLGHFARECRYVNTRKQSKWSVKKENCGYRRFNSKSLGFGIESSNSMESDISSGDETLTDSAYENFKREKAYKAVPPPTGTIIPPRANVSFTGIDELAIRNKVVNQEKTKSSQSAIDRNKVIIEDWVDSDDEETDVSESQKETAFNSENSETSFENRSPNSQNSVGQESRTKGLGNKGGKLCFVCYSPNHLIKDCNLHERTFKHTQTHKPKGTQGSRETRPVWNNIQRVNHSNFSRNSRYPHQRRSFIPSAVLTRDGLISTARPTMTQTVPSKSTANVTYQGTARSRVPQAVLSRSTDGSYYPRMDNRRPRISSYSPSSRSSTTRTPHRPQRPKKIVKSIWVKKGSTVGSQAVLPQTVKKNAMINPKQTWRPKGNYLDSVNRDNGSYTLKQFEYGNPEEDLKDYAIIDSGCSGSMTGDKDKLSDFKEFKGGYVAFGNDSKGGRISGKGTIKTSCLDFEKVSYVEELKFNLLSVSQICDKKHNVLFTDKECLILSPKFKFVDEDLCKQHRAFFLQKIEERTVREPLELHYIWICLDVLVESVNGRRSQRKVQDCLQFVNFLENRKENSKGKGPEWTIHFHTAQHMPPEERSAEKKLNCPLKRGEFFCKGKEHVESTFTLSTANTPPQSTGNTPTDSDDDTTTDGVFSTNSFDAEEGGVADYNKLDSTIDEKKCYVKQPPGFEDPDSSNKVYELSRHFYGLASAPIDDFKSSKVFYYMLSKDLLAFSDSDYGDKNIDRRSLQGGCHILAAGIVLWMQNQLLDYGFNFMNTEIHIDNESTICIVKNPVFHSKTKHIQIRHHFIRDCYEQRLINVVKVHTDDNVADLLTKGFDLARFNFLVLKVLLKPTQSTACLRKVINDVPHIRAKVAGKKILISEATIRADLLFDDENGVDCFPKQVIWDTLRDIGYEGNLAHLTFSKPLFSPQWKYLVHVLLHCLSPKSTSWEQFGTNIASALVGLATNQKFNFSLMILTGMLGHISNGTPFLMYPSSEGLRQRALQLKVLLHSNRTASVLGTASFHGAAHSQRTADTQRTADVQGTAAPHDAVSLPKSPNDYTPTDASQTSGGDEGLLDIYALNREVRRLKKQTLSQAKQIIKLKAKLKKLSKFVQQGQSYALWVENQTLRKLKEKKMEETEEISLETTQVTDRTRYYYSKDPKFEDERRPRGLCIPGPLNLTSTASSRSDTQPWKLQKMRRLLRKNQAEWDAEKKERGSRRMGDHKMRGFMTSSGVHTLEIEMAHYGLHAVLRDDILYHESLIDKVILEVSFQDAKLIVIQDTVSMDRKLNKIEAKYCLNDKTDL